MPDYSQLEELSPKPEPCLREVAASLGRQQAVFWEMDFDDEYGDENEYGMTGKVEYEKTIVVIGHWVLKCLHNTTSLTPA